MPCSRPPVGPHKLWWDLKHSMVSVDLAGPGWQHLLVGRAVTPVITSWAVLEDLLRLSCWDTTRLAESLIRWMGCTSTSTSGLPCVRCCAMPCHICTHITHVSAWVSLSSAAAAAAHA